MDKRKVDGRMPVPDGLDKRRRMCESAATGGLLLLAIGLVAPFTDLDNSVMLTVFRYVFAAGALTYTVARVMARPVREDSLRVKRLLRLEVWAGVCFCVAAFFWFYNAWQYRDFGFTLKVMQNTVAFTLAGALIQIVSSWMLAYARKKEAGGTPE